MRLSSPAFSNAEPIPEKYTCRGEDISPPLTIEERPATAQTYALIVDDPDAPSGTWVHWVMYNFDSTDSIEEGARPGVQGMNDFRKTGYGGPCPPEGTHRYFFKLYALDSELNLPEGASKEQVERAMQGHIVESAQLVGTFTAR
ncbi:MAG: YbhB/YbcL family Raf kinase inhibitor-like protein [Chitinivibrionales bacterium]|nr:YbhB/YbcL family Raf kinase inhibitor-like protein [Chitinivibrionales bacterium]